MPKYVTKQRKALLSVLSEHADETLSAEEIYGLIGDKSVSISAIYRNLTELESEGKIQRVPKPFERSVYYRCFDENRCREKIHLSCRICGKSFHLQSSTADRMVEEVKICEGFIVDRNETVLFGVCGACSKA